MKDEKYGLRVRIISATPLICLIAYLIMGYVWGWWHPGWLVFLLIPIMPYFLGMKKLRLSYPICCVIAYIALGLTTPWGWHPGWIILLTIPVVAIFTAGTKHDKAYQENPNIDVDIEIED